MATSISFYPSPAERYAVLLELARTVSTSYVPAELGRVIYTHVSRVLLTTSFTVALVRPDGDLQPELHVGPGTGAVKLTPGERGHLLEGDFVVRARETQVEILAGLTAESRLVGCLVARRGMERPFDATDAHFLLAVGAVAGVAFENARLFGELKRGREEAELLELASRELGRSLEVDDVADRVVNRVMEIVEAPATLWIVRGNAARPVASAPEATRPQRDLLLDGGAADRLTGRVPNEHGAVLLTGPVEGLGDADSQVMPLVSGGRLVAVLVLGRRDLPRPVVERRRLLERMALHALSAVENALLHEEVRRLSLTDPLVQLPNRRQLDFFLEKEFAAAQRGRSLCFVLFDLDRFKEYNDTLGHQAGDQALIHFADVLRMETRAMNLAARYGGEEFAAVLSETSKAAALGYAQRVRRRLSAEVGGELTVSAGVAVYDESMALASELVAAADRALYRAKEEGRNRVCLADPAL
ncbi:MAG TPA: diguanylate cyclase [Longimicrobiales bacterium]